MPVVFDRGAALAALTGLESRHRQEITELERLNAHYEGRQPLTYMAPELVAELGSRLRQVVVNWPQLVVDSLEERLDIEGFRMGGSADADEGLWGIWQANNLDQLSPMAHVDAMVMRRAYVSVSPRGEADADPSSGVDADVPLITVESPLQMIAVTDPRTKRVRAAAKWWSDDFGGDSRVRAAVYLPDSTSWWVRDAKGWILDEDGSPGVNEHDLGVVPVVPLVNRPRIVVPGGQAVDGSSDLDTIVPLSDAACKLATDMMVTAEFHAMPRRYAIGVARDDFVDANGNPIGSFSRVAGRVWSTEASKQDGVEMGQFPEAQLTNFIQALTHLAQMVSSVSGLAPHYLGMTSDNPASADAIRSSDARQVKRAERKARSFGESWERVMRLALLVRDGRVPGEAAQMETMWRDPSTPTIAQTSDAVVKRFQSGIVPKRQSREDLGYSAVQIERMEEQDAAEADLASRAFGINPPTMPGMSQVDSTPVVEGEGAAA